MPLLSLHDISKRFGKTAAVADVSFDVERGEFFGLLGPSGCGKTTTLRIIAGLESPDHGAVKFDGRVITNLPPEHRGFGMVFQNYALFPHLNVFENVAFGLHARRRGVSSPTVREGSPREEINERVNRALDLVQLPGFSQRRVEELSGGQQQRVAIARAIAIEPPLRALVDRLSLTAIYVTHDQEEAFTLCDRIAVMNAGRILQIGTPRHLYEQPANVAVAKFLGRYNLIRAMRLTSSNDLVTKFKTLEGGHTLVVRATHDQLMHSPVNRPCLLAIRPEAITVSKEVAEGKPANDNQLVARVEHLEFAGAMTLLRLNTSGLKLEALVLRLDDLAQGEQCVVSLPPNSIRLLPEA